MTTTEEAQLKIKRAQSLAAEFMQAAQEAATAADLEWRDLSSAANQRPYKTAIRLQAISAGMRARRLKEAAANAESAHSAIYAASPIVEKRA